MELEDLQKLLEKQREYFKTGETLDVKFRIDALKKLKSTILSHQKEITDALTADLGKSEFEGFMCEVGLVLSELSYMIKHTKRFAKEKRVKTPISQFPSKSYRKPSPYGNTLIMSPWNYPFLLTIDPLVDSISAGNTAIVKPSAYSPATSAVIEKIISKTFDEKYVAVVTGGRKENSHLLAQKFDMVFFTGSEAVGKEVLRNTAEHLTPAILELGGKSPCIVDSTANISLTAKRIVFGKYLNVGQTCVAPDYVLCEKSVKDELVQALIKETKTQFGENPLQNPNYGKIINEKHYTRLMGLIDSTKVVLGGNGNKATNQIEPTIMDGVTFEDAVMGEEIFGPILPIITVENMDEVIDIVSNRSKPLALYLFTQNKATANKITSRLQFGGGCINDTIIHLASTELSFGGVGESGMGSYHGKYGFEAFSHTKNIVNKKLWLDLPMRYQPYTEKNEKLIKMFLK